MNRRVATIAHAAGLVGALLLLHASGAASAATAWRAEPGESRLTFMATQAGAEFEGRFKRFTPQIRFDPADLPGSRFVVEVDTRSADTQDGDRDAALASSDFFAADRWPTARFETTGFTDKGGGRFEARARLTIRDVTRDVLLPFSFTPEKDGHHATLAGGTTIRTARFWRRAGRMEGHDLGRQRGQDPLRAYARVGPELALIRARRHGRRVAPVQNLRAAGLECLRCSRSNDLPHKHTHAGGPHVILVHGASSTAPAHRIRARGHCLSEENRSPPRKPAAAAPAADALEGQVDIVAWPGYVERGDTDKSYDWVTAFEQETSCKVNVKTAGTSDEMVSLMTQGGYDLVTASGDASLRLIRGGTVQPVDISRIPSYVNVDDRLKEAPWHYVDGKHYGTPYQWGPNVLMYSTKAFKSRTDILVGGVRAAEVPGRQGQQGPHPGL